VFDAAFVQRDAAELLDRGWKISVMQGVAYFEHLQLGPHPPHTALLIQQQADIENSRLKSVRWLCFLLFVTLMGHALYLFIGV
jgi:hypothetical protein